MGQQSQQSARPAKAMAGPSRGTPGRSAHRQKTSRERGKHIEYWQNKLHAADHKDPCWDTLEPFVDIDYEKISDADEEPDEDEDVDMADADTSWSNTSLTGA